MNLLATIAGLIGGPINAALGLVSSTMQEGFKAAIQFHKEGIAFARDVGLSAKQAQAYTNVLIERTQVLANKYGVSAEAIMQVQRGITEATGKQLLLNDAQAEGFVQINKLVGAQSASKFTEEIMNGMGGQIDTVQGAIAKVYATASKQGLNAKKLTDKVAQNLSMANRLSFRNGIDGLTRMAAMSEKLGINMSSVESAAGQFMDLDKAIENAAQLQMLGGSVGTMAGNPLTMAYEANYDPEAFAKRMSDSLASYATFDKNKGIANINGGNMMFIREIAKAMGISVDEASKMAKKRAEVEYKENKFGGQLNALGLSEEQKNFIINNGQVTNNGNDLEINGKNINQLTPDDLKNMMQFEGMSDRDILEEQAKSLISIDDKITGAASSVAAAFAKGIDGYLPDIGNNIQKLGEYLQDYAEQWGKDTGQVIGKAMHWINGNGDKIKSAADSILGIITNTYHWFADGGLYKILLGFGGYLLAKWGIGNLMGKLGGKGVTASGAISSSFKGINSLVKGIGNSIKGSYTNTKSFFRYVGDGFKQSRNAGNGFFTSIKDAFKAPEWSAGANQWRRKITGTPGRFAGGANSSTTNAAKFYNAMGAPVRGIKAIGRGFGRLGGSIKNGWSNMGMMNKFGMGMGVAAGAIEGFGAISNYNSTVDEINNSNMSQAEKAKALDEARINRNSEIGGAAGTAVGSIVGAFFGPIGMVLGPLIGKFVGEFIGKYWDPFVNGIKKTFSLIWEGFKSIGNIIGQGIKFLIDYNPIGLLVKGIGKLFGQDWSITKGIGAAADWVGSLFGGGKEKHANGGIVGASPKASIEAHANGGIVGGTSYGGDKVLTGLNSGEMVLNKQQQANLFAAINNLPAMVTSILVNRNDVRAKEYGANKEYIYVPNRSETSNVNGNQITVKDFNINLTGTIKLDGGNNSKNVDVNSLLSDRQFINNLKELIKNSINEDMNGGRVMNDRGTFLNHPSSYSVW